MIVDPDFFEHWRTRMLVDTLGDEMAPMYIMRLWAHCHQRKGDVFDLPAEGIKALCRYNGDAEKLEAALVQAGWISRTDKMVTVEKWSEHNKSLRQAWSNGNKGGRPKKTQAKPSGNPSETQGEPKANPAVTQREPNANPVETDRRGEERRGVNTKTASAGREFDWDSDCPPSMNTPEVRAKFDEWEAYRRSIKVRRWKPLTIKTKLSQFDRDGGPSAFIAAVDFSIGNGYQGLIRENDRGRSSISVAQRKDSDNMPYTGDDSFARESA